MESLWQSLNNREWAILVWMVPIAIFVLRTAGDHVLAMLKLIAKPQLLIPLLGLLAWVAAVVVGLRSLGWWDVSLLKDTLLWCLGSLAILARSIQNEGDQPAFYRNLIFDHLKVVSVVEFVLGLMVMPLWAELIVVPVLGVLALLAAVAKTDRSFRTVETLAGCALAIFGLALAALTVYNLTTRPSEWLTADSWSQFRLSPLLMLGTLPYILVMALFSRYQRHFILVDFWLRHKPELVRPAKWGALSECKWDIAKLNKLKGEYYLGLQSRTSAHAVRDLTRTHARHEPAILTGEAVHVEVVPFNSANGHAGQAVGISWKNTSDQPASKAYADILAFDQDGNELSSTRRGELIFYAEDASELVQPGSIRRGTNPTLLVYSFTEPVHRVDVTITRVEAPSELQAAGWEDHTED